MVKQLNLNSALESATRPNCTPEFRLKHILLNIAQLPTADQRWLLGQLANEQLTTFNHWHGWRLLERAQRFRSVKIKNHSLPMTEPEPLPAFCVQLAAKAPLYTAIILEQGCYSWQTLFLHQFDQDKRIKTMLEQQVPDIKEAVKQILFGQWEQSITFDVYLENAHG